MEIIAITLEEMETQQNKGHIDKCFHHAILVERFKAGPVDKTQMLRGFLRES